MLACAFAVGLRSVRSIISTRTSPNTSCSCVGDKVRWQHNFSFFFLFCSPMQGIPDALKLWRLLAPLVAVVPFRLTSFIHGDPCSSTTRSAMQPAARCLRRGGGVRRVIAYIFFERMCHLQIARRQPRVQSQLLDSLIQGTDLRHRTRMRPFSYRMTGDTPRSSLRGTEILPLFSTYLLGCQL